MDKFQRIMLINQYLILEKLYPDKASEYALHRIAFEDGFELNYDWALEAADEVVTREQCQEVIDILQMHRVLLRHFNEGLISNSINEDQIKFRGFDGNTETEHFAYANYFINNLGRFQEQLDNLKCSHSLNSHGPTLVRYLAMLNKWNAKPDKYNLQPNDIDDIVLNWSNK